MEVPELALEQPAQPGHELDGERPVQPELLSDAGDVLGGREVAGDQGRRVAGGQVEEQEDDHGHHPHDGDGGQDSPDEVGPQPARLAGYFFSMFHRTSRTVSSTPVTLLRWAMGA